MVGAMKFMCTNHRAGSQGKGDSPGKSFPDAGYPPPLSSRKSSPGQVGIVGRIFKQDCRPMAGTCALTDSRIEVVARIGAPSIVVCLSATCLMFTPISRSDANPVDCNVQRMLEKLEKNEVPDVEFRLEGNESGSAFGHISSMGVPSSSRGCRH